MAATIRDYVRALDGTGRNGLTVNLRTGVVGGPPGAILSTTTTDTWGKFEFTGLTPGNYDVEVVDGTSKLWWKYDTVIPQSFGDGQIAAAADILLTKLNQGTIDDTVDPATSPTTLQARLSQFAALLKRLGGGATFNAPSFGGGLPNALTNGDLNIWQRGTSFAAMANATYGPDCWRWTQVGSGVITWARDTSVPTLGANAASTPYSLKMTIPATADASIAAGDLYAMANLIEGFDIRTLMNGFALSFWVKAHRTGIYCVSFRNQAVNRSYVAEYTINVADTWEYKTVVVPAPTGTWLIDTGLGMYLGFAIAGGSTFQTTANAWNSVNALCTSNQVNGVGATSDVFSVALVNLVPGAVAVPLVPVPIAAQLARCQRYYQRLSDSNAIAWGVTGYVSGTDRLYGQLRLPVEMGGAPTLSVSAVGDHSVTAVTGGHVCTAIALELASARAVQIKADATGWGATTGQAGIIQQNAAAPAFAALEWNPV